MTIHISHRHAPVVIQKKLLKRVASYDVTVRHDRRYVVMYEVPVQTIHVAEDSCGRDHHVDCDVTTQRLRW